MAKRKPFWTPPAGYRPHTLVKQLLTFMAFHGEWYAPAQVSRLLDCGSSGVLMRGARCWTVMGLLRHAFVRSSAVHHVEWPSTAIAGIRPATSEDLPVALYSGFKRTRKLCEMAESGELLALVNKPDLGRPLYIRILRFLRDHMDGYETEKLWTAIPNSLSLYRFWLLLDSRQEFQFVAKDRWRTAVVQMSANGFLKDERLQAKEAAQLQKKQACTQAKRLKTLRKNKRAAKRATHTESTLDL